MESIMAQRVFFQKTRLFFKGMGWALKSGAASNEAEKKAYKELADLVGECFCAIDSGQQDAMIQKLEGMMATPQAKDALQAMLDGTHEDVPEWLRKDK